MQHEILISGTSTTPTPKHSPPEWLAGLGLERFVAIDLETTGLTPSTDEIIEIGAVLFENGAVADVFQTLINPGRPLPNIITSLTGITDRDLVGAPKFEEVRDDLLAFLGSLPIVGQNTSFDLGFLVAGGGADFRFPGKTVLDTAELARIFWAEFPRFSLSSLCSAFKVQLQAAHRANDDAQATGEILVEMVRRLPPRVWGKLTAELASVANQGHHRSEEFFENLYKLSIDLAAPVHEMSQELLSEVTAIDTEWLSESGVFESKLSQFAPRAQQTKMAQLVSQAFEQEEILLLEAPTGTGKSLGYLVPALEWALGGDEDGSRQVVISSHTRSLQEQLLNKDIRDIEFVADAKVPASVLKGRDNYLCKRRFRSALLDVDGRLSDGERHKLLPLIRWSHLTTRGDVGEIGGFRPEHEPLLWSMVCSDGITCSGAMCGANRGDFYRQAVDDAKKSKLLLVNHALLSTDFARFVGGEGQERRLVIDEAHQFERAVVSAATVVFSLKTVRNVLLRLSDERSSRGSLTRMAKDISDDDINTELVSLDVLTKSLYQRARLAFQEAAGTPSQAQSDESRLRLRPATPVQGAISNALAPLIDELDELSNRLDKVLTALSRENELPRDIRERILDLRSTSAALTELIESGKLVIGCDDSGYVFWIEYSQRRTNPAISLSAAPIFIADELRKKLWSDCSGAVLTSATLAHRGDFTVIESALGLRNHHEIALDSVALDSPFDLPNQMRCFCPVYLPDAKQSALHIEGVADLLSRLLADVRKSTLVLCTSHASADELTKRLAPVARKYKRQVFQQRGGRDTHEMLKAFRDTPAGMLIGSASLWEGIDLVGDALQVLVVVKLPFDVPTEPWHEARGELAQSRNEDPFYSLSVPSCAIRLRQGLGRLIRHADDRGIAIIADNRLVSTRYGKVLQQSLPVPVEPAESVSRLIDEIEHFFENNKS